MSIWYLSSGITYEQYLQANSFVRDITGQVRSISHTIEAEVHEQTIKLVASNEQLARSFGSGFDSVRKTLSWGFNRIELSLQDVEASIASFNADFNYSMGLLLEQIQIHNDLMLSLIDRLDEISTTLKTPTLTQFREFYNKGCKNLTKGLLKEALEEFLDAEKKNKTDFFTQFSIGNLYLYGINEDDNVYDSEKAKHHLLLAARYAKAEIEFDPTFSRLAAEALLHASIAVYAKSGDGEARRDRKIEMKLLTEAKDLTLRALKIYPQLTECVYHLAKYSALLNDSVSSLKNLKKAIIADKKYSIKADIDHAFDPIREKVIDLQKRLKIERAKEAEIKIRTAKKLLEKLEIWHPDKSSASNNLYERCKQELFQASKDYKTQTYFGFIESLQHCEYAIELIDYTRIMRIDQLESEIENNIESAKGQITKGKKRNRRLKKLINEVNELIDEAEKLNSKIVELEDSIEFAEVNSDQLAYEAYNKTLAISQIALQKSKSAREKSELFDRRNSASIEYVGSFSRVGAVVGGIIGMFSCLNNYTANDMVTNFNLISGAIIGCIIAGVLGYVIGQLKE